MGLTKTTCQFLFNHSEKKYQGLIIPECIGGIFSISSYAFILMIFKNLLNSLWQIDIADQVNRFPSWSYQPSMHWAPLLIHIYFNQVLPLKNKFNFFKTHLTIGK